MKLQLRVYSVVGRRTLIDVRVDSKFSNTFEKIKDVVRTLQNDSVRFTIIEPRNGQISDM
jgi:hypothetical protein